MPQQGTGPVAGGRDGGAARLALRISLAGAAGIALSAVALGACGGGDADRAPPPVQDVRSSAEPGPTPSERSTPPTSFGCIRGGTSRGEVLELMGEPDSVVYGVWLYGSSEVSFGYGVVLDYSDVDGVLRLCADATDR